MIKENNLDSQIFSLNGLHKKKSKTTQPLGIWYPMVRILIGEKKNSIFVVTNIIILTTPCTEDEKEAFCHADKLTFLNSLPMLYPHINFLEWYKRLAIFMMVQKLFSFNKKWYDLMVISYEFLKRNMHLLTNNWYFEVL